MNGKEAKEILDTIQAWAEGAQKAWTAEAAKGAIFRLAQSRRAIEAQEKIEAVKAYIEAVEKALLKIVIEAQEIERRSSEPLIQDAALTIYAHAEKILRSPRRS